MLTPVILHSLHINVLGQKRRWQLASYIALPDLIPYVVYGLSFQTDVYKHPIMGCL